MSVTTFNCPTCQAPLDDANTTTPTVKCPYCGTTIRNPFFKDAPDHVAMPVININVGQDVHRPPSVPYYQGEQPYYVPTVAPKNRLVAFLLCLFFGWFGAHRFYTGHFAVGLIQFFTGGLFGIWWLIDLVGIVLGTYRDANGLPLGGASGNKPAIGVGNKVSRRAVVIGIVAVLLICGGLAYIGERASEVDVPAETGWITGVERCIGAPAFGNMVLPDGINIWQDWGDDLGQIVGTVQHGETVTVLEGRRDSSQDKVYYKIRTDSGLTGWVSEAFIQFQSLDRGVVPLADC